jgi:hypothetical protein
MLSVLFSVIDSAKKLGSYAIANLAMACLLEEALDRPHQVKLLWETEYCNENWELYSPNLNYYDIAVISDGIRSACVPAPILKDNVAKAFMSLATLVDRYDHKRDKLN